MHQSLISRYWEKVDRSAGPDDCWPWRGCTRSGYGMLRDQETKRQAHRIAYEIAHGEIADGLQVDHVCHTRDLTCKGGPTCAHRRCVNPAHLEAVTKAENQRRGRRGEHTTHCPQGHAYDEANTYQRPSRPRGRSCRACVRAAQKRRYDRLRTRP